MAVLFVQLQVTSISIFLVFLVFVCSSRRDEVYPILFHAMSTRIDVQLEVYIHSESLRHDGHSERSHHSDARNYEPETDV